MEKLLTPSQYISLSPDSSVKCTGRMDGLEANEHKSSTYYIETKVVLI
jgi:hypothetical protein